MNFTNNNFLLDVENRIEQLFDFFSSTLLRREEYFVALYLLFLYHKKIDLVVKDDDKKSNINVDLSDLYFKGLSLNADQAQKLHNVFKPIMEKLGYRGLKTASEIISSVDSRALTVDFSEIFDRLLYKLSKSQGRFSGEFLLPIELSRFVCSIPELTSKSTIYNPFAGLASFGVFIDNCPNYFGQEINLNTWAIGLLRIMAYDRNHECRFVQGDSISYWNPESKKYDLILANPPVNKKLPSQNYLMKGQFGKISTYTHFFIERGLNALNSSGSLIAVIPQSSLLGGPSEQYLRNYLIENDLIEMIIAFPGGLLMNTGIPITILVINKNKKDKGKVKLINAQKFVETTTSKEKKLNDYALNSAVKNPAKTDVIRIVSNETIRANRSNLNVPRYFIKEFDGVNMRSIGTIIRGKSKFKDRKGKLVRIRDLKDNKLEFQLSVDVMDDIDLPSSAQCIEESCVIMALRLKTLKPTFFKYTGTPVFLTSDTLAFKVDESKVDPAFLINELNAEYVVEQLNAYRIGETIPAIKREDLLSVKINLPSIEEQRAKVTGILEISAKITQLQAERNALAHGFGQKQFNEFASLKHTLGTPRQNILSYAEALISFFEKNPSTESEKVSTDFKEKMGVDLNTAFQAIKHDINFISELLEKGENGLQLSDYILELINLQDLEKLISKVKSAAYNYSIKIQPLKSYNKAEQGIISNSTLLKILLDNILINAQKHGFESKKHSNEVVVDLSLLDDNLIIDIKNNGKKFPKGFDKDKFIAKYSTANPNSGTGIGGYDINRIIEYFNGTWDLILNEDTIYPVRFRIQFPIKPII